MPTQARKFTPKIKPFVLVVLDGWGYREEKENNPIAEAHTPFFDHLWDAYPHSILDASEESVGLPSGQIGNSEIGHMTIGAGRVIDTDLVRITKAMRAGHFLRNDALKALFAHCVSHDSILHVVGLVSPGGIHSHSEHLYGFLEAAKASGVGRVAIHAITDGRDTPPKSGAGYLEELEEFIAKTGVGRIASVSGRFYAMDRDKNWDRLAKAEAAIYRGEGETTTEAASAHVRARYEKGDIDEHLQPFVVLDASGHADEIGANDGVFMFNFRADRCRQLASHLIARSGQENIFVATMTQYDKNFDCPVAYPQMYIETTLAAEISRAGFLQAHIAETEKYAHVTYFVNGGREKPHEGEEHVLIESRKDVKTHDLAPEMRAKEITDAAIDRIRKGVDFMFINYANADMVGHTAQKPAVVIAVETVDRELKRLIEAVLAAGGAAFITADHGNAETHTDPETGELHTAHTLNLVPAILTRSRGMLGRGTLADVAPTVLSEMGLPVPPSMTGRNLHIA